MSDASASEPITKFGEELEHILATAFAIRDGLIALNAVTEPKLGINILRDVIGENEDMNTVIAALRDKVEGEGLVHKAIIAFYAALPGDALLRDWVRGHLPASDAALVSEALFEETREAYAASRDLVRQSQAAAVGFAALREKSGTAAVAELIAKFHGRLAIALKQLQLVNNYKQLHDQLHTIQTRPFNEFARMLLKPDLDDADRKEIVGHVGHIHDSIAPIRSALLALTMMEMPYDESWVASFEAAIALLGPEAEISKSALRRATASLRSVLSLQLSALNKALIEAARSIPFEDLTRLLSDAAGQMKDDVAAKIRAAAQAIERIGARLEAMILLHDRWQDLDTLLWGFELAYPAAIDPGQREDIAAYWTDTIVALARALEPETEGDWADVHAATEGFDAALQADPPQIADLGRAFFKVAAAIRVRFYYLDRALLDQCVGLMPLLPELRKITEEPS